MRTLMKWCVICVFLFSNCDQPLPAQPDQAVQLGTNSGSPGESLVRPGPFPKEVLPGYPVAREALASKTCYSSLRFDSRGNAVRGFDLVQVYYSDSKAPGSIAVTDSVHIWIFRSFLVPNAEKFKLQNGDVLTGLELWDEYFQLSRGFFTVARFQAMALIHEYQHIRGVALPDYDDQHANYLNSILTIEHCFPAWVPQATLNRLKDAEKSRLQKKRPTIDRDTKPPKQKALWSIQNCRLRTQFQW